ncbi:hypothetical protein ACIP5T_17250 [Microbacterium sp. NPDC088619]|uniref:hypothetical protein n=1 Tax=Microbacterium sp. NPDC088619 TaxID=3364196 RepID=UPI003821C4AB
MAKVHEIGVGADTRGFEDQIKSGLIKPTEDAEKALKKLGDTDAGTDAARDLDKLEDALRDAQRASDRTADSMDDVGDKGRRAFDKAKDGVDEFRDEANSTAREAAASFDGSAESIADAFQEVAANAFAGFGPAGAVAGIAAAAGIGLAAAGFESVHEAEEKAAELASEWADRFVESGQRVATAAQQSAAIVDIATDADKYKEATENAELWGTTVSDAMLAMAGNAGAIQVVEDALNRKREATEKDAQAAQEAAEANGSALLALTPQEVELTKAEEAWRRHTDAMATGAQQANDASNSLLSLIDREKELGVAVDELGNKVVALPDGTEIFIDAKTGQATADVSRFKGDTDGVIDHLNGRDIVLQTRASVYEAQRAVDNFISHNDGKSFRLNGRVTVSGGGQIP